MLHESERVLNKVGSDSSFLTCDNILLITIRIQAKTKYEMLSEEWERTIIAKEGPAKTLYPPKPLNNLTRSFTMPLTLLKQPNPSALKMAKYEEDARARVAQASMVYRNQLRVTNEMRQAYYQRNLPRFIRVSLSFFEVNPQRINLHYWNV
jgi:hypothetical protein